MQADELMVKVAEIWAADAGLSQWCNAQFGKALSVFVGINEDQPPEDAAYPLLAVMGVTRRHGTAGTNSWDLDVGAGVINASVETAGAIQITRGILQAEQLIMLSAGALRAARFGKLDFTGEHAQINFDDKFLSYDTIRLEVMASRRRI